MKVPRKAVPVYVTTILYAVFIFFLSSTKRLQGSGGFGGPGGFIFDKFDHLLEYTILGMLLYLCFHLTPLDYHWIPIEFGTPHQKISLSTFLLGTFYGLTDELHQMFVPGRSANPLDAAADTVGIILAILLMPYFLKCYRHYGAGGRKMKLDRKGKAMGQDRKEEICRDRKGKAMKLDRTEEEMKQDRKGKVMEQDRKEEEMKQDRKEEATGQDRREG